MKEVRWWLVSLSVVVLVSSVAGAAEEAPVWWGNVELWEMIAGVVVFIYGATKMRDRLKVRLGKKVTEFLEEGVQRTYDEFVRDAKTKSPEGKLTAGEVKHAREKAWYYAQEYAKKKGLDLAKKVAAERVPSLISKVVNNLKNRKK